MKDRQKLSIVIVALLGITIGLSVAYAALSTTLNVAVNTVSQSPISFGLTISCSLTTTGGTSATGRSCGAVTNVSGGLSVTIADTVLSKPDDYCLYTCTIANGGDISASLGSITPTAPSISPSGAETCSASGSTIDCTYIKYELCTAVSNANNTHTCTTALTTSNGAVAGGASKTVYLLIKHDSQSMTSTTATLSNAKYVFTYNQA